MKRRLSDDWGFLEDIHARPRDDGLRMIYADWLEDRGSSLSELIRWQVATKRKIAVHVGRSESRLAHAFGPGKGEAPLQGAVEATFDHERFVSVILPEANKWIRPFPPEARHCKPQVVFARGLPCIEWQNHHVCDLEPLNAMLNRLLPHLRVNGLILPLDRLTVPVGAVLSHMAICRVNHLAVPVGAGPDRLLELVNRLADSDLPDRLEWFILLGLRSLPAAEAEAILQLAAESLGQRMRVS